MELEAIASGAVASESFDGVWVVGGSSSGELERASC